MAASLRSLRAAAVGVVEQVAPALIDRRRIRRASEKEVEVKLLPALCDRSKTSFDIGANIGLYCHHLLKHSAKVHAFEPLPAMQRLLARQFGDKITLHRLALSDGAGKAIIRLPTGNPSWATMANSNKLELADATRGFEEHAVSTATLDSLGLTNVGFIKIDVEGFEEAVLAGASATIRASRPCLLVEMQDNHNPGGIARVTARLAADGIALFFVSDHDLAPIAAFDLTRDQRIENVGVEGRKGRFINNFIAVPSERVDATLRACRTLLG